MSDFISFDPAVLINLDKLNRRFGELNETLVDVGTEAAGKYLLNIFIRKEIPAEVYVSRKAAYGVTFFSDKQRRWFFWYFKDVLTGTPGRIYKRRSPNGGLAASWEMIGTGRELTIQNTSDAAAIVYGDDQARQLGMVGWKKAYVITDNYAAKTTDAAARAIEKEIKRVFPE